MLWLHKQENQIVNAQTLYEQEDQVCLVESENMARKAPA